MSSSGAVIEGSVRSRDGTRIGYLSLGGGQGGVVVLGGALRSADDYLPFARELSRSCAAHVVDRRGRGSSGPKGTGYGIERECEDLLAVQAATGADAVFGHSFGGLVVLETLRRADAFSQAVVYEPGVSMGGSIPLGWLEAYRERLAVADRRGAFAAMVRGGGFAPSFLARLPLWYVKLVLRLAVREQRWRGMAPLLESSLAEHEVVGLLDDGSVDRFQSISARVLLLSGSRSPAFLASGLLPALVAVIPNATAATLEGLDHLAPDEKAPASVAERVLDFLSASTTR